MQDCEKVASVRIGGMGCTYHCVPSRMGVLGVLHLGSLSAYLVLLKVRNLGCDLRSRKWSGVTLTDECRRL